jgi:hypothetical protein
MSDFKKYMHLERFGLERMTIARVKELRKDIF